MKINTKTTVKTKQTLALFLALTMIFGFLPISTLRAYAAPGDIWEIWRGGTMSGSYGDLSDALVDLIDGDTLLLLDDLDYEGNFNLEGTGSNPMEIVLDLNGYVLNILGDQLEMDDIGAYAMSLVNVNLTVDRGITGKLNIVITPEPIDSYYDPYDDETYYYYTYINVLMAEESSFTLDNIIVASVSEEANYNGGMVIQSDDSVFEIIGSVSAPVKELDFEQFGEPYRITISNSKVSIGGDFNGTCNTYRSELYIEGDANGTFNINGGEFTVKNDLNQNGRYNEGLNIESDAVVEIFGDVTNVNEDGYGVNAISYGNEFAKVTVHGDVWSINDAVVGNGEFIIMGDVTSFEASAIRAHPGATIDIHGNASSSGENGIILGFATKVTIDGTFTCSPNAPYVIFGENDYLWPWVDGRNEGEYDRNSGTGYFIYEHIFDAGDPSKNSELWVKAEAAGDVAEIYNMQLSNATDDGKPYYSPNDMMNITLYGEAGGTAKATVTYDDAIQNLTAQTAIVNLTESTATPGLYSGTFTMAEGISKISGVLFTLEGIAGKTAAEVPLSAYRLPEIRGGLRVTIINDYFTDFPALSIIGTLTAAYNGIGNSIAVDFNAAQDEYIIVGIPVGAAGGSAEGTIEGTGITLTFRDQYNNVTAHVNGISVTAGQLTPVSITPEVKAHLEVALSFGSSIEESLFESYIIQVQNTANGSITGNIRNNNPALSGLTAFQQYRVSLRAGIRTAYDSGGELNYFFYPSFITKDITPDPGENSLTIHLPDYILHFDATLEGIVTLENGQPISGATVTVTQSLQSRGISSKEYWNTITDENGYYSLPILSACETTASVTKILERSTAYLPETTPFVTTAGINQKDIAVGLGQRLETDLRLYAKSFGDADYSTVPVYGQGASLLALRPVIRLTNLSTNQTATIFSQSTVDLVVVPGDEILVRGTWNTVVASLYMPDYQRVLTVDNNYTISDDFYVMQTAAVDIKPVGPDGNAVMYYNSNNRAYVSIMARDTNTNHIVKYQSYHLAGGVYRVYFEEAETYELLFSTDTITYQNPNGNKFTASRTITASDGDIIDYGDVIMNPVGSDVASGSYVVAPVNAAPGGIVTLMASYERMNAPSDADSITLQIPSGTTFIQGSLTKNSVGLANPIIDASGRFQVPVTAADANSGFVAFRVKVNSDITVNHVFSTAVYRSGALSNSLGTAEIYIETISLEADAYTYRRDIHINGLAPAGSLVKIYDRGVPIGEVMASPAGYWNLNVILPGEDGVRYRHELVAATEHGGSTLISERQIMIYDPNRPGLSKLIVYGMYGTVHTVLDAGQGPVSFPYTLTGKETQLKISAVFTDNSHVQDVYIQITSPNGAIAYAQANYNAITDAWDAVILDPFKIIGASDFSEAIINVIFTPSYAHYDLFNETTNAQLRNQLPGELSEFSISWKDEGASVADGYLAYDFDSDPNTYSPDDEKAEYTLVPGSTVLFSYDVADIVGESSVNITITELASITLPATLSEFNRVHDEIQVYNYQDSLTIEDDTYTYRSSSVIYLIPPAESGVDPHGYEVDTEVTGLVFEEPESYEWTNGWGKDITENLVEATEDLCENTPESRVDSIFRDIRKVYTTNSSMQQSASIVTMGGQTDSPMDPVITGAGIVTDWMGNENVIDGINDIIDEIVAISLDECGTKLNRDRDFPDTRWFSRYCSGYKTWPGPYRSRWIHDPSGIVYEVSLDNPIDGVTATLLFEADSDQGASSAGSGDWSFFDMEWYRQINPYITGSDGWYEWDVPMGNWMVMYEKEGYKTEYSNEMYVPPIRLDVHQALEYQGPAIPIGAYFTDNGDSIEIVFERYVKASDINGNNINVYSPALAEDGTALGGNEFLSGSFAATQPVVYKGQQVAKAFIFTLEAGEEFMAGTTYYVSFSPSISSYADIPLGFDDQGERFALSVTTPPPVAVKGIEIDTERYYLDPGDTVQASAQIVPANAANQTLSWTSSDTAVATVGVSGLITAVDSGICYVTATSSQGGFEAYVNVYVSETPTVIGDIPVTGVLLSEAEIELELGESLQLTATVLPGAATNKEVTWSTGCGGSIATVDATGLVTAVGEGSCVVTVTTVEGGFKAYCIVTVTVDDDDGGGDGGDDGDDNGGDNGNDNGGSSGGGNYGGGYVRPPVTVVVDDEDITTPIDDTEGPLAEKPWPVFDDINLSDWFYEYVESIYQKGLMNGTSSNMFSPSASLSRAMLVTILWRMEEEPDYQDSMNPFNDVQEGQYYTCAVKWAQDKSIVEGYGSGKFGPMDSVTRQDLAIILIRYMSYKGIVPLVPDVYLDFADETAISGYAKDAIQILCKLGIITGTGETSDGRVIINPKGTATRAQVATMLHRYLLYTESYT